MSNSKFPKGWDENRVQQLIAHYDSMTEAEQVAEDEAAVSEQQGQVVIAVPETILSTIRQLIAEQNAK